MMPVFGEGECLYGILEKCRLGDRGVEYDPIACLTCAIIYLVDSTKSSVPTELVERVEELERVEQERIKLLERMRLKKRGQ